MLDKIDTCFVKDYATGDVERHKEVSSLCFLVGQCIVTYRNKGCHHPYELAGTLLSALHAASLVPSHFD